MMTGPDTIFYLDENRVDQLVSIARKPGVGGRGVPVSELSDCNFKLLVYLLSRQTRKYPPHSTQ